MTIAELKTNVANTFPRQASPTWSTYFDTNLPQWLSELCDFPFWFLVQSPSPGFYANFPITDWTTIPLRYGDWSLNGWLVLQPGVTVYSIAAPFEEDQEASGTSGWWDIFRCGEIQSAKLIDDGGRELCDLELKTPNSYHENFLLGGSALGGEPRFMALRTTELGSSLVVWPKPDKNYALKVCWSMGESPVYERPGDTTDHYSKFLNFAPQAVFYKCLYHSADFFDEDSMMQKFAMQLWGTPGLPKVDTNSITQVGGIIGRLKDETYAKGAQMQQQAKWWPSLNRAVGKRTGSGWGGQGRLPWGYGYWL